jgi:glycosyltransferase involved in cell wall biosynthesis
MPDRLLELELTDLKPLPDVSTRHGEIRILIRLDGTPLGVLRVNNDGRELQPAALAEQAAAAFAPTIWAELESRRWLSSSALERATDLPAISAVVCTRDRAGQLAGCLDALAAQSHPAYEILVVDNSSRDDATVELCRVRGVRCVVEPRPGLDWARNRGLAEALHLLIAYTDDDARPDRGWLAALAAEFASGDVAAVSGLVAPAELETAAQMIFEDVYGGMGKGYHTVVHSRRGRAMVYAPEQYGVGCNMAFRRDALDRIGGFDPALDVGTRTGGGGDLDVFQRLIEADATILYTPSAIVRHMHRRSLPKLRRQLFDNGRGYSAVLWACLLRARGLDRVRVVRRYWSWIWGWHLRRILRRILRREELRLKFLLAELAGAPLGPLVYWLARRDASRLVAGTGESTRGWGR